MASPGFPTYSPPPPPNPSKVRPRGTKKVVDTGIDIFVGVMSRKSYGSAHPFGHTEARSPVTSWKCGVKLREGGRGRAK